MTKKIEHLEEDLAGIKRTYTSKNELIQLRGALGKIKVTEKDLQQAKKS